MAGMAWPGLSVALQQGFNSCGLTSPASAGLIGGTAGFGAIGGFGATGGFGEFQQALLQQQLLLQQQVAALQAAQAAQAQAAAYAAPPQSVHVPALKAPILIPPLNPNPVRSSPYGGKGCAASSSSALGGKAGKPQHEAGKGMSAGTGAEDDETSRRSVFVGGMAAKTVWQELKDHMMKAGKVQFCEILTEEGTEKGTSKGFGCARFMTEAEANVAVETLNGTMLQGRNIVVDKWLGRLHAEALAQKTKVPESPPAWEDPSWNSWGKGAWSGCGGPSDWSAGAPTSGKGDWESGACSGKGDWGGAGKGDWGGAGKGDFGGAGKGDWSGASKGDWGGAGKGDWGGPGKGDWSDAGKGDWGGAGKGDWGASKGGDVGDAGDDFKGGAKKGGKGDWGKGKGKDWYGAGKGGWSGGYGGKGDDWWGGGGGGKGGGGGGDSWSGNAMVDAMAWQMLEEWGIGPWSGKGFSKGPGKGRKKVDDRGDPQLMVYVGGLRQTTDWKKVKEHMAQAGEVGYVKVLTEDNTEWGKSRGVACIRYETREVAHKAVEMLHKQVLDGKALTVTLWGQRNEKGEGK